jgi:hypothetical protein
MINQSSQIFSRCQLVDADMADIPPNSAVSLLISYPAWCVQCPRAVQPDTNHTITPVAQPTSKNVLVYTPRFLDR